MKWLSVLIVVVVLVTGVAVHGSGAIPVAGHSVAFAQCGASGAGASSCRSLSERVALGVDEGPGDTIGVVGAIGSVGANETGLGGDISPDRWLQIVQGLLAIAVTVASNWDKLIGGGEVARGPVRSADDVFDPIN